MNGTSDEEALVGRGEAVDLFSDDTPDISVAQVARRYAMNANLIFKWLRDPCLAPAVETAAAKGPIEIELSGGYRVRISGAYDREALAHLIRDLSG